MKSELKRCPRCGLSKNKIEYYKCKRNSDGLQCRCKDCNRITKKERDKNKVIDIIGHRLCKICNIDKELVEFNICRSRKFGRQDICKKCRSVQNKSSNYTRILDGNKVCGWCKRNLEVNHFHSNRRSSDGLASECKICIILRKYNLNYNEYIRLLSKQNNKCAICNYATKLYVDHDHTNGMVRGLLCHDCNIALGCCKDNLDGVKTFSVGATKYLGDLNEKKGF